MVVGRRDLVQNRQIVFSHILPCRLNSPQAGCSEDDFAILYIEPIENCDKP